MLVLVLFALFIYLMYAGYKAGVKRDKRFREGSKFVMNKRALTIWVLAVITFFVAAFFLNHS